MALAAAGGSQAGWPEPGMLVTTAYGAYAAELKCYVAKAFGGQVVAEDVVHEAFVRLIRETSAGREPMLVRAWLYRVVHNLAVSELRHRPARREPACRDGRSPGGSARSAEAEHESRVAQPGAPGGVGHAVASRTHQHRDGCRRVLGP